jgi:DNA invertase Pin-like site-specific DNA recombinase
MKDSRKPVAYSYIRYSHPDQAKGDSLHRQMEATAEWCSRNGVDLDINLSLRDEGVSAFRGKHRRSDRHALARFLDEVRAKRVPRGSYLVIENLDRLSREDLQPALLLVLNLLQDGVRVVQLRPEMVFDDKSDTLPVMMMMVELSRGHSESRMKSDRIGAAWRTKKAEARKAGSVQTTQVPGWLQVAGRKKDGKHATGGTFKTIPARVKVVRHIFKLAIAGEGLGRIVDHLTKAKVRAWGYSGKWNKVYVFKILTGRAVLGEYQPTKRGEPDGEVIPGYFPSVIAPETWQQAQDALASRRDRPGSPGKRIANLFSGLLWDARSKGRMLIGWMSGGRRGRRTRTRTLVSADSLQGRGKTVSFQYGTFENAILEKLQEVDPAELGNGHSQEVAALENDVAQLQRSVIALNADLDLHGDSPAVLARLRRKESDLADALAKLAEARRKQHHPPATALASAKPLLAAARDEESRHRLRQLLRAAIESIWVLVVPGPSWRIAAAQVNFHGGVVRRYAIMFKAGGNGRASGSWVESFATIGLAKGLDLRRSEHVAQLKAALLEVGTERK